MSLEIVHYTPRDWAKYAEAAHKIAFSELLPHDSQRIDFALLVACDGLARGYVTCREHDKETLYWQFGGAFPGTRSTALAWPCYLALVEWCQKRGYKRITTLIENTNLAMLKMAMKVGFRIHGVRYYHGILVEHLLEFA